MSLKRCVSVFLTLMICAGLIAMMVVGGIYHEHSWGVALLAVGASITVCLIIGLCCLYHCLKDWSPMG